MFVDVRVEDSGSYICSVPTLDETKRADLVVVCKSNLMSRFLGVYEYIMN